MVFGLFGVGVGLIGWRQVGGRALEAAADGQVPWLAQFTHWLVYRLWTFLAPSSPPPLLDPVGQVLLARTVFSGFLIGGFTLLLMVGTGWYRRTAPARRSRRQAEQAQAAETTEEVEAAEQALDAEVATEADGPPTPADPERSPESRQQ